MEGKILISATEAEAEEGGGGERADGAAEDDAATGRAHRAGCSAIIGSGAGGAEGSCMKGEEEAAAASVGEEGEEAIAIIDAILSLFAHFTADG